MLLQGHLLAIFDPKGFAPIHSPLGIIRSVTLHQDLGGFEPPPPRSINLGATYTLLSTCSNVTKG